MVKNLSWSYPIDTIIILFLGGDGVLTQSSATELYPQPETITFQVLVDSIFVLLLFWNGLALIWH